MINESLKATIKAKTASIGPDAQGPTLSGLNKRELLQLRSEIDALLPKSKGVKELDLSAELLTQYETTRTLMAETMLDTECSPSQKASVCNAVVTILSQLVKLQENLKLQQTFKLMERVFIEAIKTAPENVKAEFFEEYERLAIKEGLM
jgi:hypothetical protein